jgi:hypothetical protein
MQLTSRRSEWKSVTQSLSGPMVNRSNLSKRFLKNGFEV